MFLGLDIGTSGIKAVIVDEQQNIVEQAHAALTVQRPKPLWSEQDPADWWRATAKLLAGLNKKNPEIFAQIQSIGLSGQMHGAVLLDEAGQILRPAILWNDGRAGAECQQLEHAVDDFRAKAGNMAMPGFTAPKLLWVQKNEPEIFDKIHKVLLPKDYIRFCLTGDYHCDMSDGAGTIWMDIEKRCWSDELLRACGLTEAHMPKLVEGSHATGKILPDVARVFGLNQECLIVGGAGDNAAGAVGIGAVHADDAFISLGTSGVLFTVTDQYVANPNRAVHAFCHAIPGLWHQMSVILSAASAVDWAMKSLNITDIVEFYEIVAQQQQQRNNLLFLPYLSGERTPHNDPDAKAVFFGMDHETTTADMARAVLEGVGFAFRDGLEAIEAGKLGDEESYKIQELMVIGGGSRSEIWGQILADILECRLVYPQDAELGPAFGAARLAILAAQDTDITDIDKICTQQPIKTIIHPKQENYNYYQDKYARFKRLYQALAAEFK